MVKSRSHTRPILLVLPIALAVTPMPAHAATLDLGWVVDLAFPYVETALIALAALALGWLASRLGRWLGVEIDREHADALHAAIARGVRHALSLVRAEIREHAELDVENRLIAETAIYLEELMPDALQHFGLTDDALDRLIRAHLGPEEFHWVAQAETAQSASTQ
ncbi:MAG: hypothetical protein AAF590_09300 [Pseudomonadota bacterium]